jgi:hypothetical protein
VTAAGFAIPGVSDFHFVEIVVLDFQLGVTFGAGGHTSPWSPVATGPVGASHAQTSLLADYNERLETGVKRETL